MDIKFLLSSGLLLTAASAFGGEVQHGIIKLDGSGRAILIVADPLVAGQTVYFQYPGAKQQPICCKRLLANEFVKTDEADTLATNEVTGNPPVIYNARIPRLWAEVPFVGAATIGQGLHARGVNGQLVANTRHGQTSRVETCTSQEGVHLIVGDSMKRAPHLYLGLGYDIERPTCK